MFVLYVCRVGSNDLCDHDCLIILKKPNCRVTCMAGPIGPEQGHNVHNLANKSGVTGR